ncbi:MAG: c-type cytochrome, partial [Limisphaerales bacterium]
RAINDLPISGAMRELGAVAERSDLASLKPEMLRRVLNANYRYGTRESAKAIANMAANEQLPEQIRADALRDLSEWERPSGRDRITGMWRPVVGPRSDRHAVEAIEPEIVKLIFSGPDRLRVAAAGAAGALKLGSAGEALLNTVKSEGSSAPRLEALKALAAMNDPRFPAAVQVAAADQSEALRKEALRFSSVLKPAGALAQIERVLENGTLGEKQSAIGTLGNMPEKRAEELLLGMMDRLLKSELTGELHVDLLEAATKRDSPEMKAKLQAYDASLPKSDELSPYRAALTGGSIEEGKKIFFERAEAQCVRCHTVAGQGSEGGQVGPELTKIGATRDRTYLLESLVFPNKHIAEGFQSVLVTTRDGTSFAGVVKSESDTELELNSPEDGIVKIKKIDITGRERGISSMPEGLGAMLSRRDLRDLVAYLSSLK